MEKFSPIKFSIIVPIKNLKEITQVCLDSIKKYTKNYQLILIDDGSDDETKEFLETTEKDILIRNETSLGGCKAINQGSEEAIGEYVVMINSDIVMTPNWSERMIAKFERDNTLGILGCTSSNVNGYQHVDFNKEGVDFQYADALSGFCLMLKREVFNKLLEKDGYLLDERFGLGGQDDSDICYRVRLLGYKVGIARDVFIYHYGSATIRKEFNNDIPYSSEYAKSREEILRNKYKTGFPQDRKPFVMIAIPNLGHIRPELAQALIFWSHNPNYNIYIYMPTGILPLGNARSHCVNKFIELSNHEDDRLWFIDDDIIPPLQTLDVLMKYNQDIIGALCFMMKPDDDDSLVPVPVVMRYNEEKKYIVYFDGQGLTEVDALGGGCIMSKRKVFEKITQNGDRLFDFQYYLDGTLSLVGDFHFCQMAQKNGFKVWVDFNTICGHVKDIDLKAINDVMLKISKQ